MENDNLRMKLCGMPQKEDLKKFYSKPSIWLKALHFLKISKEDRATFKTMCFYLCYLINGKHISSLQFCRYPAGGALDWSSTSTAAQWGSCLFCIQVSLWGKDLRFILTCFCTLVLCLTSPQSWNCIFMHILIKLWWCIRVVGNCMTWLRS